MRDKKEVKKGFENLINQLDDIKDQLDRNKNFWSEKTSKQFVAKTIVSILDTIHFIRQNEDKVINLGKYYRDFGF
jgi:soluble cytochrome b562